MKLRQFRRAAGISTAVLALSVSLAACGSEDEETSTGSDTSSQSTDTGSESASADDAGAQVFGPACSAVPKDGKGSFNGMVTDPVATAASNNPLLSTLVKAVGAAKLGDTLNQAEAITVFAPYNDAFAAVPADTLNGLLAGAEEKGADSDLAKILTHHVVGGKLDPTQVVGKQETLAKDSLTIEGDTEAGMTVSDGTVTAKILCGNIPTANATVYVIDSVLTGLGSK